MTRGLGVRQSDGTWLRRGNWSGAAPVVSGGNLPVLGATGTVKSFVLASSGRGGAANDPNTEMVANNAQGAYVHSDGAVVTTGYWGENGDEAHYYPANLGTGFNFQSVHTTSTYAGGPSITIGAGYAWTTSEGTNKMLRRHPISRSDPNLTVTLPAVAYGVAVIGSVVYAACADGVMRSYNTANLVPGSTWTIPLPRRNGLIAVNGYLAVITAGGAEVRLFSSTGGLQSVISSTDVRGLGVDNRVTSDRLIVCKGAGDHRLAVYDISNPSSPTLVEQIGVQGGMMSSVGQARGNATDPKRFMYPRAARITSAGQLTVVSNTMDHRGDLDSKQGGTIIRRFANVNDTAAIQSLYGLAFVDTAYLDPVTGVDAFTACDWYKLNHTTGNWSHYAHTLDAENNNDVRGAIASAHGATTPWIVYFGSTRFLVTTGMYGLENPAEAALFYKQVGETFVSTGVLYAKQYCRGFWISPSGRMWLGDDSNVRYRTIASVDGSGNPVLSAETVVAVPTSEFDGGGGSGNPYRLTRAMHDEATDTLYVAGWRLDGQGANPATGWDNKIMGNTLAAYGNFLGTKNGGSPAGFSQRLWRTPLPAQTTGTDITQYQVQASMDIAGDYVFVVESGRSLIRVFLKSTGAFVKEWIPGSNGINWGDTLFSLGTSTAEQNRFLNQYADNAYRVGYQVPNGKTGIGVLDVVHGLNVVKHSNGVYTLLMQDDGAEKVCWMQWTP